MTNEKHRVITGHDGYRALLDSLDRLGLILGTWSEYEEPSIIGEPNSLLLMHYSYGSFPEPSFQPDQQLELPSEVLSWAKSMKTILKTRGIQNRWSDGDDMSRIAWIIDDFADLYESCGLTYKTRMMFDAIYDWLMYTTPGSYRIDNISDKFELMSNVIYAGCLMKTNGEIPFRNGVISSEEYDTILGEDSESIPPSAIDDMQSGIILRAMNAGMSVQEALDMVYSGIPHDNVLPRCLKELSSMSGADMLHNGNDTSSDAETYPMQRRYTDVMCVSMMGTLLGCTDRLSMDEYTGIKNVIIGNDDVCVLSMDAGYGNKGYNETRNVMGSIIRSVNKDYMYQYCDVPALRKKDDSRWLLVTDDGRWAEDRPIEVTPFMIRLLSGMRLHHDCSGISDSDIHLLETCMTDVALGTNLTAYGDCFSTYYTSTVATALMIDVLSQVNKSPDLVDDAESLVRLAFEVCSVVMPQSVKRDRNDKVISSSLSSMYSDASTSAVMRHVSEHIKDYYKDAGGYARTDKKLNIYAMTMLWLADRHMVRYIADNTAAQALQDDYIPPHPALDAIASSMFTDDDWTMSESILKRRRLDFAPDWPSGH